MKPSEEFENLDDETKEFLKELCKDILRRKKMSYRYHTVQANTFAEVAKLYNTVKPIVSKNHSKEDDLRPVGVRSRKWERIIKINDQKYILNNGECDQINFWPHWNKMDRLPTMQEVEALAPIVWSIDDEGNEFIKIRNGSGESAHQTRYAFLQHTLPYGMRLLIENGKQYIEVRSGGAPINYFLPKSEYFWKQAGDKDDGRQLHFTKPANSKFWLPQGNTFMFSPPKKRIDKKRKADLKDAIEGMWGYIGAMWTLVDIGDGRWDYHAYEKVKDNLNEHYFAWSGEEKETNYWWSWKGKGDFIAHVFKTEDHPCRVDLLDMFVRDSDLSGISRNAYEGELDEKQAQSRVRNQYNRWINTALELEYLHSEKSIVEVKGER
jgi:hypothetical protein